MATDKLFSNRSIARADAFHPFPQWVADADLPSTGDLEKAGNVAFAEDNRQLPILDKVTTFLSAVELLSRPEAFSEKAASRVKRATEVFGIEDEVAPYADLAIDQLEKLASAPAEISYAIELDGFNGDDDVRVLPLIDKEATEYAASEVWKMASEGRLPHIMLVDSLKRVTIAADKFDADIPERMIKMAYAEELRWTDWDKSAKLLSDRHQRSLRGEKEDAKQQYSDIVKSAAAGDISPDDAVRSIAAVDLLHGIVASYALKEASVYRPTHVHTPTEIVYCGDEDLQEAVKAAAESVILLDAVIPLADFRNAPFEEVRIRLSKEASDEWEKIASTEDTATITEFLDSLSNEDTAVFTDVLLR